MEWLGGITFDGALVFDECHKAKNCIAKQASGSSRKQSESKTSRVSITLHKSFTHAQLLLLLHLHDCSVHVLSATAVTETPLL